jgi:hypothetical protein
MVLLLPVSQSVAATPFCGVELNFTLVDFSDHDGQDSSVDALNNTARLKADGGAFGAENNSNAELDFRFTPQSSGPAKTIFSGILAVGRVKGASNVNEGQVSDYNEGPVTLTMMVFKVAAARANRCTYKREPSTHEGSMEGD